MSKYKTIGIVGGVGPYAGLDLNEKIFRLTQASRDQEHLNVLLYSLPSQIEDRTEFLEGKVKNNPALGIYDVLKKLESAGSDIVGIPCNTAHAPEIWNVFMSRLKAENSNLYVLNMIVETAKRIIAENPGKKIGVLGTNGTVNFDIYGKLYKEFGLHVKYPDAEIQKNLVHPAIYDASYGIKAKSNPVSGKARDDLFKAIEHLIEKDVDAIVLGCTEIPLAIEEENYKGIPLLDSTMILARSLVDLAGAERIERKQK
jgi:aspartate racemase